jgi:peptide chain release factor
MPSRPKPPPEAEIAEKFLKGSGPGGQKIVRRLKLSPTPFPRHRIGTISLIRSPLPHPQNKTNSAVQLKHIPTGIVVKCQETRSRDQNRKIARQHLAMQLDILYNGDKSRAAIVGEAKKKKTASASKKSRRKYRKLAEAKEGQTRAEDHEEHEQEDEGHDYDNTPVSYQDTVPASGQTHEQK